MEYILSSDSDSDYSYSSDKRNSKKKKLKKKDTKRNKKAKKNKKVPKSKVIKEKNITQDTLKQPINSSDDNSQNDNEQNIIAVVPINFNTLKSIDIKQHSEEYTGEKGFKRNEDSKSSVLNNCLDNDYLLYKNNDSVYNNTNNNVLKSLQPTKLETSSNSALQIKTHNQSYVKTVPLRSPSINIVPLLNYEPEQKFLHIEPPTNEEDLQINHQVDNNIGMLKLLNYISRLNYIR